jgi:hypothetical protein
MNKSLLFIFSLFISVSITAQTISNVTVTPSPADIGGDISITLTYNTDDSTDNIYYALDRKGPDGWIGSVSDGKLNGDGNSSLTTNADTEVTLTLPIPTTHSTGWDDTLQTVNTAYSADLPTGEFYEFKIEIQTSGGAWQTGSTGYYGSFTISTTASVAGAEKLPATVYPNPTKGVLHLATSVSFDAYKVISLTGKVVEERSHTGLQSIDVSHLNKGIYFLQVDAYKPVKFVKQ